MAQNSRYIKQAYATVDFSGMGNIGPRPRHYVFEMDDRVDLNQYKDGTVRVRRYPSEAPVINGGFGSATLWDSLIYGTIKGSLTYTQEVREREVSGMVEFSGTDRVQLPYPKGTMPSSRRQSAGFGASVPLYAGNINIRKVGQFYNTYGHEINPVISIDDESATVIASQPCYGEIEYDYITDYRIIRYHPRAYRDLYGTLMWGADDYGSIIAQRRISFLLTPDSRVVYEPPPPIIFKVTPPNSQHIEWELYRVESTAIVNEDGTWERPMLWPADGDFESSDLSIDPNAPHLEVKRLHEIAMFSLQERETFGQLNGSKYFDVPLSTQRQAQRLSNQAFATQNGGTEKDPTWEIRLQTPSQQYIDRVKNFRTPKMRVQWYEQPLQKPYDDRKWPQTDVELAKYAQLQAAAAANPNSQSAADALTNHKWPKAERRVVSVEIDKKLNTIKYHTLEHTFKIRLNITAGRPPAAQTTQISAVTNINSTQKEIEAQLQEIEANKELSRAWQAIDWGAIRKSIIARYPEAQYQLTFDSTFPATAQDATWPPPPTI